MQEKPVIVNNTPLVALWSLDRFALLRKLKRYQPATAGGTSPTIESSHIDTPA